MKSLYDNILNLLTAENAGWWIVLGVIAVVLVVAVCVSLFRLHEDIEDRDRVYPREFDYNPSRRW